MHSDTKQGFVFVFGEEGINIGENWQYLPTFPPVPMRNHSKNWQQFKNYTASQTVYFYCNSYH